VEIIKQSYIYKTLSAFVAFIESLIVNSRIFIILTKEKKKAKGRII